MIINLNLQFISHLVFLDNGFDGYDLPASRVLDIYKASLMLQFGHKSRHLDSIFIFLWNVSILFFLFLFLYVFFIQHQFFKRNLNNHVATAN